VCTAIQRGLILCVQIDREPLAKDFSFRRYRGLEQVLLDLLRKTASISSDRLSKRTRKVFGLFRRQLPMCPILMSHAAPGQLAQ
jgi:hypothetical protein